METSSGANIAIDVPEVPRYKVYRRRWYILGLFATLCCLQFMVWNTFGPIIASVQYAYAWSNGTVAMMANWGTITFVIFVFPLCWFLEIRGLRVVVLCASSLVASGAVLRVINTEESWFLLLSHLGSILNGIAGVTVMSAPPALSAIWFPPHQRTTATCIGQVFTQIGTGLSFTLGPALVPEHNMTSVGYVTHAIHAYLWIEAGMALTLLVAVGIYFPKQPPSPPSASASIERTNFLDGLKFLMSDPNALLCTFAYGLSGGTFLAWQAVMTLDFQLLGVDDVESGKIGLAICISCSIVGMSVSYGTDHLRKHMKKTLIALLLLEALFFLWLALLCNKTIPFSLWQLYICAIGGSSFTFSLAPLFFEYTVELTYPTPEGLVGGFLTCFYNFVGICFLCIFFIPNVGQLWMNYVLVGAALASIPAVYLTKETYRRLEIDVPSSSRLVDQSNSSQSYHALN